MDALRLDPGGLLGAWQARNAAATLPHCIDRLEEDGALPNLRRVPGGAAAHRGMWFSDSDVYKTLEAAAWELGRDPSQERLAGFLRETAGLLAAAQDPDGYLDSYFQHDHPDRRWQDLTAGHELYCAGHLIQAAVAAARAGAGDGLLAVARRLADLVVERFGTGDEVCGHPEIETALVELFRLTGHRPYLDLAAAFVDRRGHGVLGEGQFGRAYHQDHEPVRRAAEFTGHAVRQVYLLAGAVDVAVETGDAELLAAAERLWESAFSARTYITGAHGSRHRDEAVGDAYELPPDRAYAETCAAIGSFQWNWRLLLATGRSRYAEEMERALYNAIAVATAADGVHYFYSNPLQLRTGHDGSEQDAPSRRLPWYTCACCPPNLARLIASLHCYAATEDDGGLQLHLYAAGELRTAGRSIAVQTGYPWDGRVTLTVAADTDEPWTLALRVPSWCGGAALTVDGAQVAAEPVDGYLRLTRSWLAPATVVLDLPMPPRLRVAHPRVDAVRGCVALTRGPLVFAIEQADLPPGVILEDVAIDPAAPVRVVRAAEPGALIPVSLAARGEVRDSTDRPLYADRAPVPAPVMPITVAAVPYFLWANRTPGAMRVWIPVKD
jgi:hypothetical protein